MSQFTIMMIWGSLTIVVGIIMFFSLQPNFDCSTLPNGYWANECQHVNLVGTGLPFLPIALGLGIIICGFKFCRDTPNTDTITERSSEKL